MTKIRGIVFDKDGTLFDFNATWGAWSLGMIEAEAGGDPALLATLSRVLGYDMVNKAFHPGSIVIAETTGTVADHILPHLPGVAKDDLVRRMKAKSTTVPQVEAVPLRPLMEQLRARGLILGIATNDAEGPAHEHLRAANLTDMMDFVAGFDSGYGGKPAPGQLLAFCAATGLAPEECLMVGDSLHDLHAGAAAGMVPVGVLTGPASEPDLAPHAAVVLRDIGAIPGWLDQRHS